MYSVNFTLQSTIKLSVLSSVYYHYKKSCMGFTDVLKKNNWELTVAKRPSCHPSGSNRIAPKCFFLGGNLFLFHPLRKGEAN